MAARLPLSVILTTVEPWPDLSHILQVLQPQVEAFGGEIIVAASDFSAPAETELVEGRTLRRLRRRDTTIPKLRAMAAQLARGEIVAMTEDDCVVAEDWCAEVFHGFALYPLARAITGVTRDATRKSSDEIVPRPLRWSSVPARPMAGDPNLLNANIAYQRAVLPMAAVPTGFIERDLNPRLLREGSVVLHDRMVVNRVRQRGLPGRAGRLPMGLPAS
jgi:hypothetical protein